MTNPLYIFDMGGVVSLKTNIIEKEGFLPEQTFFIDDTERYVFAAGDMGISVIHFKNADALAFELERFLS